MNIILIGFMGTGKTAVGQQLAREKKMDYLDTDQVIEKVEKKSINDIFAQKGEEYFRFVESEVVKMLAEFDNLVIATGGGIILRQENVAGLKRLGPLVLLWAEPEVIYERIKNEAQRPLLKVQDPMAEIKKILESRQGVYHEAADHLVNTSKLTVNEIVEEIEKWLRSK
jgi:shikimate kinase